MTESGGNYFSSPKEKIKFIKSGCGLLDNVLGGGYVLGRIANIVGDRSSGKTLLAIEASANFARDYPEGMIWYREVEAAFDEDYASALGMPVERVDFGGEKEIYTVEDVFEDMKLCAEHCKKAKVPGLYILDSLDALSDKAEMSRGIDEGTFGASKAKQLSQLFRRIVQHVERSSIAVLIISQVRDNIGVSFGEKHTRSGGRALDFYASQIIFLAQTGKEKKGIDGVERITGINVRAKCKKNKIALPFRECDFTISFGFGIDDIKASVEWLCSIDKHADLGMNNNDKRAITLFMKQVNALSDQDYSAKRAEITDLVNQHWCQIEQKFLTTRKKY